MYQLSCPQTVPNYKSIHRDRQKRHVWNSVDLATDGDVKSFRKEEKRQLGLNNLGYLLSRETQIHPDG